MSYTVRDYQGRVNAIFNEHKLVVDGMLGPNTRAGIEEAKKELDVSTKEELFHESGLKGIIWHWTASDYDVTPYTLKHYNDVHDYKGNSYDGAAPAFHQVNYDWRKGIGVSHTRMMNTGFIGQAVAAMGDAEGWPMNWGTYPLTWEGIDAMLERSAEYCNAYDIPISKWSTLTHAEVQPTLGVTQNGKWDYMVLPGYDAITEPVACGDVLRMRMKERFMKC